MTLSRGRRTWGGVQIVKIISGGQTGVDRAALDVALELGLEAGGWCPRGRIAEDGRIADHYPLAETPTEEYAIRTEWNVRDSDATLILARGGLSGGTAYTVECADRLGRPCIVVNLDDDPDPAMVRSALRVTIRVLNVAGPRESTSPGIYLMARDFLRLLFG
jgi:hypothetical protein